MFACSSHSGWYVEFKTTSKQTLLMEVVALIQNVRNSWKTFVAGFNVPQIWGRGLPRSLYTSEFFCEGVALFFTLKQELKKRWSKPVWFLTLSKRSARATSTSRKRLRGQFPTQFLPDNRRKFSPLHRRRLCSFYQWFLSGFRTFDEIGARIFRPDARMSCWVEALFLGQERLRAHGSSLCSNTVLFHLRG